MILRSAEAHLEAEAITQEITELRELDITPFPYDGCRWLRREFDEDLDDLIPDLDLWFSMVAGYAGGGKRLIAWPEEKVLQAKDALNYSFFEQFPKYAWIERHITETNTPDLFEEFSLSEQMRKKLLGLFNLMLAEKYIE